MVTARPVSSKVVGWSVSIMSTVTMYDADNPYDIPRDAKMVAGYIDGSRTTWRAEWWTWFPQAVLVTISAVGARWDADLFDVEPGCIWPPENVLPLVVTARSKGRWPAVYCNEKNHWAYIRNMFRTRGMEEPPYIVANYDGVAVIPAGAVGKQYKHPPQIGKHYDLSVVKTSWKPGRKDADDMLKDEMITTWPEDFREIGKERPAVSFDAATTVKYASLYAGAAYETANEVKSQLSGAIDRVDAVVDSVAVLTQVCQDILRRLDAGGSPADIEAAAQRAKELIGKDLADEETGSAH